MAEESEKVISLTSVREFLALVNLNVPEIIA